MGVGEGRGKWSRGINRYSLIDCDSGTTEGFRQRRRPLTDLAIGTDTSIFVLEQSLGSDSRSLPESKQAMKGYNMEHLKHVNRQTERKAEVRERKKEKKEEKKRRGKIK